MPGTFRTLDVDQDLGSSPVRWPPGHGVLEWTLPSTDGGEGEEGQPSVASFTSFIWLNQQLALSGRVRAAPRGG